MGLVILTPVDGAIGGNNIVITYTRPGIFVSAGAKYVVMCNLLDGETTGRVGMMNDDL